MIEFNCPKCAGVLCVPESLAGQTEKCPACGNVTGVPGIQPKAAVEPSPEILDLLRAINRHLGTIDTIVSVAAGVIVVAVVLSTIAAIALFVSR